MTFRLDKRLYLPVDSNGGGISSGNGNIGSDPGGIDSTGDGIGSGPGFLNRAIVPDPNIRRTDLMALHPLMRTAVNQLKAAFQAEQLPFRVFESFRTPARQAWLFAQGRARPGLKVTNAEPWRSYHQYGLAADFVLSINGEWSWNTSGPFQRFWNRLHELGAAVGLEPLSFERPHLQVVHLDIADLQKGILPEGGDDAWHDNFEAAIISWHGSSAAPPRTALRPALPEHA